jgi:UDP-N-acetylenolpyruvoylglucosamine reductase
MLPFLEENKDLLKYSSFHTPATARYFFELKEKSDIEKLPDISRFAQAHDLPIVFLGSGTNVVFAFETFEGVIVRNMLK